MKKKILLSLALILFSYSTFGQINSNRDEFGNIITGPYITNSFWDNIFITPSVGAFLYLENFKDVNLAERVSFVYQLAVGKWITPSVGVRIKGEFAPYASHNNAWGAIKHYDFFNIHTDFMWNLSNVIAGYRHKRTVDVIPYLGLGYGVFWQGYSSLSYDNFSCNVGVLTKFRVTNTVAFNVELGSNIVDNSFNNVTTDNSLDFALSTSFGVTINFGGNKRFERVTPAEVINRALYQDQIAELVVANQELKRQNQELSNKIDTLQTPIVLVDKVDASPVALFFEIGRAELDNKQLLNLDFYVKNAMKLDQNKIFTIISSADDKTGSSTRNAVLSQDRLNYITSLLLSKYGIPFDRMVLRSMGDRDNRFEDAELNRVVIIE